VASYLSDEGYLALRVLVNVARNCADDRTTTTVAQLRIKALAALPPGYEDAVQEALKFWAERERGATR
jgi:hypothetical protein